MLQILQERRNATLLTALFLICFTLMSLSARWRGGTTVFDEMALSLTGPLIEAAAAPKRWTGNIWSSYVALRGLSKENKRLVNEVAALRGASVKAQELQSQVERLEGFLRVAKSAKGEILLARIVGRNQSPFGRTLIIDQGKTNGILRNMAVIHQNGIVGRVFRAGHSVSQILLITDTRSSVDILVQRSRAQGVFSSSSEKQGEVRYMPADADVKNNDLLVSSGFGGIFPKGLPVARVVATSINGKRLFKNILATPSVDFNKLEEVMVMLVPPKESPWR
ncbi:MAG: rod shape-determining protein MreC [Nitrospinaceae bacterium]|jgi:rod shape-determining protein MreC|nr:rod shape-determining protein MreC [Nitrospinaceae bacterium]MBT3434839.1 rod shape-determining protein MreC [Nitrospinaceae bacterium]MBT3823203.1 rod shape-determining protein MreC [Nitrospinaceae bacterium]MBT4092895.1 rod shape-determining protein MreC [Nitrospinaceae bacterium]MBT4429880.1 rod shape-determining protein MreC [Nitrospinaceae bacterium]